MANVVVVGGGVVGAMAAYYLNRSGWTVTVVDRGRFGQACSRGNCGYVCPSHVLPLAAPGAIRSTLKTLFQRNSPLKVRPGQVLANLGWFLGFARKCNDRDMLAAAGGIKALLTSSRGLYSDLIRDESLDCDWEESGLWFVFAEQKSFDHYADVNALLTDKFATPAERFDADQLFAAEPALKPGAASGGYLYRNDAQLRPDRLTAELHRVLTARGVTVVENRTVTGFRVENRTAKAVTTNAGEIPADAVVVAAGAWTPHLNAALGTKVPIVPGKGYSVMMPRPAVCPRVPMIFEDHRVAVSPFPSGYRIGSTMEFAGYDGTVNRKRLGLLTAAATHYLREPLTEPVEEEWTGFRPMVYDGNPVIGFAPAAGNVLIAAGHGMLGLSMATGTGKLAAELLAGTAPHLDPAPYSPARFGR